ncbi:MAG: Ribonuclease E [Saprospiraceae bacterium]|nr:Ribonuclease E [Saprospiraceae bacterium]
MTAQTGSDTALLAERYDAHRPPGASANFANVCDGLFLTPVPTPVLGEGLLLFCLVAGYQLFVIGSLAVTCPPETDLSHTNNNQPVPNLRLPPFRPLPVQNQTHIIVDKELIINASETGVELALLEGGKLVELHHQKTNNNFTVGDILIGKIRKMMPGLNAAFVDIGHRKDAFLHYTDLGPKLRSLVKWTNGVMNGSINTHKLDHFKYEEEIVKTGKVDQVLNKRWPILVQILKEPISTKGPRLSCELTLPGRYMVLSPFSDAVSVSKKIASGEERKRLHTLAESIKPKNFGLIIRTAAEGKKVQELHEELMRLLGQWEDIYRQLKTVNPPAKLLSELDKPASVLRDLLSDGFSRIVVNDKDLHADVRAYLQNISPDQVGIVQYYTGTKPIFDAYGITKQIKASFGKTATMNSGAYVVIEKTEAMHVIDVNSGHKITSADVEQTIFGVNLEAAEEIARQIRLRDIGGLIVIDFIDMKNQEHKKLLAKKMEDFMRKDRSQHTILPLSKFGLMQITRERARPEVVVDTAEVCPTCGGTGKVNATILLTDDIERDLEFIMQSRPKSPLILLVHPYLEAYLKKGLWKSRQVKWFFRYNKWIRIRPNADYQLTDYRFFDGNDDEIRLN